MSAPETPSTLDMLPWLESWWEQSDHNPLYAWEAMARCMASGIPLPPWAHDYFRDASQKMASLGWGRDFRQEDAPRIGPDEAKALVGEALGLWRPKAKNAFARRAEDAKTARAALDERDEADRGRRNGRTIIYAKNGVPTDPPKPGDARQSVAASENVTDDRAGRIVSRGRGFIKLKPDAAG